MYHHRAICVYHDEVCRREALDDRHPGGRGLHRTSPFSINTRGWRKSRIRAEEIDIGISRDMSFPRPGALYDEIKSRFAEKFTSKRSYIGELGTLRIVGLTVRWPGATSSRPQLRQRNLTGQPHHDQATVTTTVPVFISGTNPRAESPKPSDALTCLAPMKEELGNRYVTRPLPFRRRLQPAWRHRANSEHFVTVTIWPPTATPWDKERKKF